MRLGAIFSAALVSSAAGQEPAVTILKYEVRNATHNGAYSSNVNAAPGDTVEIRVRAGYQGGTPVAGLCQVIFQPLLSHWIGSNFTNNGPGGDNVVVQSFGSISQTIGPYGGTRSTPIGTVPDLSGVYGRLTPWGGSANASTSYYRGFVGTGTAAGLMRLSMAHITNWIGVGPTSGSNTINNVSGRGGINISQLPGLYILPTDPPFNADLDVVLFKFAVRLSSSPASRKIDVTTPLSAMGRQLANGVPAEHDVEWYLDTLSTLTKRTGIVVEGAAINVPSGTSLCPILIGVGLVGRRRRR